MEFCGFYAMAKQYNWCASGVDDFIQILPCKGNTRKGFSIHSPAWTSMIVDDVTSPAGGFL